MYTLKINSLHWDESERQGYRHVTVEMNGNNVLYVVSHRTDGKWCSVIIPAGFKQTAQDVVVLKNFYNKVDILMKYLESDITINSIDMHNFIGTIC